MEIANTQKIAHAEASHSDPPNTNHVSATEAAPVASHEYSPLLLSKSQQCFVIGLRKPYLGHWHHIMTQTSEKTKGTGVDVLV